MPTFKKNTSPAMKRSGFKMKSGNAPLFKHMASSPSPITSPANMSSFGVGKGTSPYKQEINVGSDANSYTYSDQSIPESVNNSNYLEGIKKPVYSKPFDPIGKTKKQIKARQKEIGTKVDGFWEENSIAAEKAMRPREEEKVRVATPKELEQKHAKEGKPLTEEEKNKALTPEEQAANAKAARRKKLGAAGRNLAEIFMGGIHNVYGNPNKTTKTSEFDEEKAYKRWAKEKSDKETMTLAQQIIADDKKKSQIKTA